MGDREKPGVYSLGGARGLQRLEREGAWKKESAELGDHGGWGTRERTGSAEAGVELAKIRDGAKFGGAETRLKEGKDQIGAGDGRGLLW